MKLVRDRIPEIIAQNGKECVYHIADKEEYRSRLKDKLREEVEELLDDPCKEELADVHEVLENFREAFNLHGYEAEQISKRITRGGFEMGLVLESVTE